MRRAGYVVLARIHLSDFSALKKSLLSLMFLNAQRRFIAVVADFFLTKKLMVWTPTLTTRRAVCEFKSKRLLRVVLLNAQRRLISDI
jgi:hypothetical protein